MEHQSQSSDVKRCVSDCDKDFISCVESGHHDCLDHFRECDRSCKFS
ncbi:hypothetical protein [Desulfatitalea alkaliphila]|uniref:Uncharacterized protein n=1 Tax=Desulfatitalea alkaliphila TaxID=2929485 RepID=A0AA41R8T8_9BACT|nr:hypothetical protein [Desulfatitalea alkaliphila]MCJ8503111.1 hypothetical protein [Desulfatitalea alkaliphila]